MQLALDVMPFLIMAAVVVVFIVIGGRSGMLPVLSLGPAFAAVVGGFRYTLISGAVAVVLCGALATYQDLTASRQDTLAFATVAGVTLAGVIASAGRQRRDRELTQIRAIAEATQQVLLRPVPDRVGGMRLAVRYMSATSGARIGGDLYEVAPTDRGLRLIVGDVQGKGLPAVQTAATVLGAFREAAHDAPSLAVITDRIEASLARQGDGEQFVTAILAQVTRDGPGVELLNCGHPPPVLISSHSARFAEEAEPGLPLGLSGLGAFPHQPTTIDFGPGEAILFYTDGVSEARDKHGAFFSLLPADPAAMVGPAATDPSAMLERLSSDVVRHVGHALADDAAMLLVQWDPVAGQPLRPAQAGPATADGSRRYARYAQPAGETGTGQPPGAAGADPGQCQQAAQR